MPVVVDQQFDARDDFRADLPQAVACGSVELPIIAANANGGAAVGAGEDHHLARPRANLLRELFGYLAFLSQPVEVGGVDGDVQFLEKFVARILKIQRSAL